MYSLFMNFHFRRNELPPLHDGEIVYLANTYIVSADGSMPIQKATVVDSTVEDSPRQAPQVFEWSDLSEEPKNIPWSIGVDRTRIFTQEEVASAVTDYEPTVDVDAISVDEMLQEPTIQALVIKAVGSSLMERMVNERTFEV